MSRVNRRSPRRWGVGGCGVFCVPIQPAVRPPRRTRISAATRTLRAGRESFGRSASRAGDGTLATWPAGIRGRRLGRATVAGRRLVDRPSASRGWRSGSGGRAERPSAASTVPTSRDRRGLLGTPLIFEWVVLGPMRFLLQNLTPFLIGIISLG